MKIKRRGKQKVKIPTHLGVTQAYKTYCFMTFKEKKGNKIHVNHESKFNISRNLHSDIIDKVNLKLRDLLLKGYEFDMPCGIGTLCMYKILNPPKLTEDGKLDTTRLKVDWNTTLKLWDINEEAFNKKKLVYHTNPHTLGYSCRLRYRKRRCTYKYSGLYNIKSCRTYNVMMAKLLKAEERTVDYYIWHRVKNASYEIYQKTHERRQSKILKDSQK